MLQRYQGGPQPTDSGEVSFRATLGSTLVCWMESQEDDFLYRILFERAADGMLLVTGEESILAANTQACHILKRSREAFARTLRARRYRLPVLGRCSILKA